MVVVMVMMNEWRRRDKQDVGKIDGQHDRKWCGDVDVNYFLFFSVYPREEGVSCGW